MTEQFKGEKDMVRVINERVGDNDLLISAANSVISHMTEVALLRDNTVDKEIKSDLEDVLDTARIQMQGLVLQMSGAIDHLRMEGKISDEIIVGISDLIAEIDAGLTEAENSLDKLEKVA